MQHGRRLADERHARACEQGPAAAAVGSTPPRGRGAASPPTGRRWRPVGGRRVPPLGRRRTQRWTSKGCPTHVWPWKQWWRGRRRWRRWRLSRGRRVADADLGAISRRQWRRATTVPQPPGGVERAPGQRHRADARRAAARCQLRVTGATSAVWGSVRAAPAQAGRQAIFAHIADVPFPVRRTRRIASEAKGQVHIIGSRRPVGAVGRHPAARQADG